jgi:hypothetical protein
MKLCPAARVADRTDDGATILTVSVEGHVASKRKADQPHTNGWCEADVITSHYLRGIYCGETLAGTALIASIR